MLLLHGIARSSASFRRMERFLDAEGFQTLNLDYPSRRQPLEQLVDFVHRKAGPFLAGGGPAHVVGHSMGGLLARAYITRHRPARLGRIVMLGPPNGGSEVADLLAGTGAYRWFFGPAGAQLGTAPGRQVQDILGAVDFPLGIIAGTRTVDPLSWLLIPGPNDGRVSVARTRVDGMAAHLALKVSHAFMVRDPDVMRQTAHFLRHGCFEPGPALATPRHEQEGIATTTGADSSALHEDAA